MSTKKTPGLITLTLLVICQFAVIAGAAPQEERQRNRDERAFQEAVHARTGLPIFDEKLTDLKRIEALLNKHINLEIKSDALARAAAHGDVELLQLLIRHGADVNHVNDQGQTVLMLAASQGIFSQCGTDPILTSYRGNAEEVESLLAAGARLDDRDRDGNTALMLAAKYARSDSVKLLLDAGADVHLKNHHGWTALAHAVNSNGGFDPANLKIIVEALVAAGAVLKLRD